MNLQSNMQKETGKYLNAMRLLDESIEDSLFLWDLKSDEIHFADSIYEKYAITKNSENTNSLQEWIKLVYERDLKSVKRNLKKIKENKIKNYSIEYRILDKHGNYIWINCKGAVRFDNNQCARYVSGSLSDTAFRNRTDTLTGLLNTVKFMEDLECCLKKGETGCLLILGVDDFKNINIKYGRPYGNQVLVNLASVLEKVRVLPSLVYRLNGDCFALILTDYTKEKTEELYHQVQEEVESYCRVSGGAVLYDRDSIKDGSILYQYAEDTLDNAKKNGKNKLIFFSIDDYEKRKMKIEILEEMQESIHHDFQGFYLCYQPQVQGQTFTLFGAEALLRFRSPTRGEVSSAEFIPVLEETGLICQVGAWVLETALLQCRKWREKIPHFHINVNISYVQLKQKDIAREVLQVLEKAGLPGEVLTLEVTESIQLQDYEYFNQIFYQWKQHGIKIAIDDFGTGYSSLSYLKSIKVDETKIDRCFVKQIQNSSYNYQLLRNMIELAHSVHIQVCCEGVETEEELACLMELQPDVLQGFLFAKPYPSEQFEEVYLHVGSQAYKDRKKQEERFFYLNVDETQKYYGVLCSKSQLVNIMRNASIGLWAIRIDPKNERYEMYADQVMLEVMGLEGKPTPEACYQHWYGRIQERYYPHIHYTIKKMMETRQPVEVEYIWKHPSKGEVQVRCLGVRVEDSEGMICLEGHHRIISNIEKLKFIPERSNMDSFEYNRKTHSICFHTKRRLLAGTADREGKFPDCWIEEGVVHPHFAEKFREIFSQIGSRKELPELEMLLKTSTGAYEWFKLCIQYLGTEEKDLDRVMVFAEPASQEWAMELEYMRKMDFYEVVLGETIAYAEVDVESGHLKRAGGLWTDYMEECIRSQKTFTEVMEKHMQEAVSQEEQEAYSRCLDVDFMKDRYKNGESTYKYCFQRIIDKTRCWVELVVHIFQEGYSGNMYALLYLKNIDAEKRRSLAQEVEANRDPLTNVYNRRAFKEEVVSFMTDVRETEGGSLIILDLDNFKKINDEYGHMKGDYALKVLTDTLMAIFRRRDIIGRLGGDEFLVFIKNVTTKEILDRRMKELFAALENIKDLTLTCSAGISILEREHFSYDEGLKKADLALYESKKKGKNRFSYYDECGLSS